MNKIESASEIPSTGHPTSIARKDTRRMQNTALYTLRSIMSANCTIPAALRSRCSDNIRTQWTNRRRLVIGTTTKNLMCSIMSAKCTMWAMDFIALFYSRSAWLPASLPFSDCQVKAILQVDIGGSGEPLSEYYSDAIDKERAMENCITCRDNEQNRLATDGAST